MTEHDQTTGTTHRQLATQLREGRGGVLLFGITPPKASTTPMDRARIAEVTLRRLAPLDLDGLIVYDIDDESDRVGDDRPFPYLTTLDPAQFAADHLGDWDKPLILYRAVGKYPTEQLCGWFDRIDARDQLAVLVGASTSTKPVRTTLREAQRLSAERRPDLTLGAVMITERHTRHGNEHRRMLAKQDAGVDFFVSQIIYDVDGTKSALSDYHYACRDAGVTPRPVIFTLALCGSLKTLDFLQWLGVQVPRWLRNELTYTVDPLRVSYRHCLGAATDLAAFCRHLQLPYGFNVESVAIRRAEIEAAVELAGELRQHLR